MINQIFRLKNTIEDSQLVLQSPDSLKEGEFKQKEYPVTELRVNLVCDEESNQVALVVNLGHEDDCADIYLNAVESKALAAALNSAADILIQRAVKHEVLRYKSEFQ